MKTIKFRIWDKNKKYFIYFGGEYWLNDDENTVTFQCTDIVGDHDDGTRFEFQQYTGLKDSKNREIFEGDIVEHKSKYDHVAGKFEVIYNLDNKDFAAFCLNRIDKSTWTKDLEGKLSGWEGVLGSQGHLTKDLEVIGNKYESL